MSFVKTGAVMVAVAGASVLGTGMAHADQDIQLKVSPGSTQLNTCLLGIGADAGLKSQVQAHAGHSIHVTDAQAAKLKAHGCA